MFGLIKKYISFISFGVALLIGIQLPTFVDEYGKNLEARYAESQNALSKFRDTANQYFDGNFEKLIQHYEQKKDPVVVEGGNSIRSIFERNQRLESAIKDFKRSMLSPYYQVVFNPILDVRKQAWENYSFTVALNQNNIIFGFIFALFLLLILELLFVVLKFQLTFKKNKTALHNNA